MTNEKKRDDLYNMRDGNFFLVGRDIMEKTGVFEHPSDKLVYVMLCMYANNNTLDEKK